MVARGSTAIKSGAKGTYCVIDAPFCGGRDTPLTTIGCQIHRQWQREVSS
jgi:hypothetical protein